jgi:hypothetical protein
MPHRTVDLARRLNVTVEIATTTRAIYARGRGCLAGARVSLPLEGLTL